MVVKKRNPGPETRSLRPLVTIEYLKKRKTGPETRLGPYKVKKKQGPRCVWGPGSVELVGGGTVCRCGVLRQRYGGGGGGHQLRLVMSRC